MSLACCKPKSKKENVIAIGFELVNRSKYLSEAVVSEL